MSKAIGNNDALTKTEEEAGVATLIFDGKAESEGAAAVAQAPSRFGSLRVAVIDDAMHPPRLDRLTEGEAEIVERLLIQNAEVIAELEALGCDSEASADKRLAALAEADAMLVSVAIVGEHSADAQRMIEEHRAFLRLRDSLENEVAEVAAFDPFEPMPDLTRYNLVLLDYYLQGPAKSGDLAIEVATSIRNQSGRPEDQQIVLMSSLERVRELRRDFREKAELSGSAFAFVGKPDLNEVWKIKAHLGMLERARPYTPALTQYRDQLAKALKDAEEGLLKLVDDLDIGDYAFIQSRALMKDGHPLGDYVFWLLSSQLMTLAFECDEMRQRQRALDKLEFVGESFAATEPSTVVANLLHSALVSRNIGPLGPHPRAKSGDKYAAFPLVQLGDVFLDVDRSKAVVVMSAACDLAFSPSPDREPDADTPVLLVPGTPIKLKDVTEDVNGRTNAKTDGILHREEVYRIVWEFSNYRSVSLGDLEQWLIDKGYDVSNRDRLRPLFALKLQQEFGAHLFRVGPPIIPPVTTPAVGRVLVCLPPSDCEEVRQFESEQIMLTRFNKATLLRITPTLAGALRDACDVLLARQQDKIEGANEKERINLKKQAESLVSKLDDDGFWIDLLKGIELNSAGTLKSTGPLSFVLGTDWPSPNKPQVLLEISEGVGKVNGGDVPGKAAADVSGGRDGMAISSAD